MSGRGCDAASSAFKLRPTVTMERRRRAGAASVHRMQLIHDVVCVTDSSLWMTTTTLLINDDDD